MIEYVKSYRRRLMLSGIVSVQILLSLSLASPVFAGINYKRMISTTEAVHRDALETNSEAAVDAAVNSGVESNALAPGMKLGADGIVDVVVESSAIIAPQKNKTSGQAVEPKAPVPEAVPVRMDRLWTSFEERRMRLDRMISDNIMHGTLTAGGAIGFREDLQSIACDLYRFITSDTFSTERAVEIAARLDGVSARLTDALDKPSLPKLVVVDRASGKTQLVADFFGDVISARTLDVDLFRDTLKERRARLGALIAGGQASGAIDAAQTDKLRRELDTLAALDKNLSKNARPNFAYLLKLAVHYDEVRARLAELMDVYNMQPLVSNSAIMIEGRRLVHLDDSMLKRAGLEDEISGALAAGTLTGAHGAQLREALNKLAAREKTFRLDGVVSLDESKELKNGLNQVASRLTDLTI